MDVEKSRCGFYSITFLDEKGLSNKEVKSVFNKFGKVVSVTRTYRRVFIWYEKKEDAIKALKEYGSLYKLTAAINSEKRSKDSTEFPTEFESRNTLDGRDSLEISMKSPKMKTENLNQSFSLILGNLPKNFHAKDVMSLIEEVKPIPISKIEETIILNLKFCEVILDSTESLSYLIDKLDGFVICGEKLIAVDKAELIVDLD